MHRTRTRVLSGTAVEGLERRRLLAGQTLIGEGPTVESPAGTAIADFNLDGKADLATCSASTNTVAIHYGDGAGGFTLAQTLAVGTNPRAAATADFNADGRTDLVVVSQGSNSYQVFIAAANGSFGLTATVSSTIAGSAPVDVVAGDFTRDGKADFAFASSGSNNVYVVVGNGTGAFAGSTPVGVGAPQQSVAAGDIDADGDLDLVAAASGATSTVAGIRNNGGGAFTASSSALPAAPKSVATGDFNGDGRADVAVGFATTRSSISAMLSTGSGTFTTSGTMVVGNGPHDVAVTDLDNNGKLDILVATTGYGTLGLARGVGNGTFNATATPLQRQPAFLTVGDFNGDAVPDVALSPLSGPGVSVVLNSDGFYPQQNGFSNGYTPYAVATADFNGDGYVDYVTANPASSNTTVWYGNGAGSVITYAATTGGAGANDVAVGDFNGDGRTDYATSNYAGGGGSTVTVFTNNGGGFTAATVGVGTGPAAIVGGDFNGDGLDDFATANDAGSVSVRLGTTTAGTFNGQTTTLPAGTQPGGLVVADFNNDGKADLAVTSVNANAVLILRGGGGGLFTLVATPPSGASPLGLAAGDFNHDGNADLAVANQGTPSISVLLGSGASGFTAAPVLALPQPCRDLVAADFDEDGNADLAVLLPAVGFAAIVRGRGTGAFDPFQTATFTDTNPVSLAVSDFNGDGRFDLATANTGAGTTGVLLNRLTANVSGIAVAGGTVTLTGATATLSESQGVLTVGNGSGTRRLAAAGIKSVVAGVGAVVNSDLGQPGGSRQVSLTANAAVVLNSSQRLATLTVSDSVTLAAGRNKFLRFTGLSVSGSGRIDLNDNDLIYDYPAGAAASAYVQTITSLIRSARSNGSWTGPGLTSTTARNNSAKSTTLGYLTAADYKILYGPTAAFAGQSVDTTAVLVRYALYGDTDLDGGVSINDFNRFAAHFGLAVGTAWFDGDFDDDGGASINDFNAPGWQLRKGVGRPGPLPVTPEGCRARETIAEIAPPQSVSNPRPAVQPRDLSYRFEGATPLRV